MNRQNTLITVIVPVYNILEYLERCVDSIISQTYKNIEIVLVDDGSTDGTSDLCDQLAGKDSRIKVYHKENGGSSSARNYGIVRAQGEYFGFVDSDDYIEPDMYENLMNAIEKYGVKIAQAARDEISQDGTLRPMVCQPPETTTIFDGFMFLSELLLHKGDCSFCTKLCSRDLFKKNKFPEGVLNEDFYLMVKFLEEKQNIVSVPQIGYHVFYKLESNTRTADPEKFSRVYEDIIVNADMVSVVVKNHYPGLQSLAMRFGLFQRLDYMLHIPISKMINTNSFYRTQVRYLRRHFLDTLFNEHLTWKNKGYLMVLTIAPKTVRKIHRYSMNKR